MSRKKSKLIYTEEKLIEEYTDFVMKAKEETNYQGMNFSRMCILGCELVTHYYDQLSKKEKKGIVNAEEFNEMILKKAKIKKN
jgi:uncharacterized GH25 family protein